MKLPLIYTACEMQNQTQLETYDYKHYGTGIYVDRLWQNSNAHYYSFTRQPYPKESSDFRNWLCQVATNLRISIHKNNWVYIVNNSALGGWSRRRVSYRVGLCLAKACYNSITYPNCDFSKVIIKDYNLTLHFNLHDDTV